MITLRFATESDDLDAQISKLQQNFWASHVEVVRGNEALRYDDRNERWRWTDDKVDWTKEVLAKIKAGPRVVANFHDFLDTEVVGKPYDMRSLAGVEYELITHRQQKWNCSDFIWIGLCEAGLINQIPIGTWHITPRDLMLLAGAIGVLEQSS